LRIGLSAANGDAKAIAMATAFTNCIYQADVSVGPVGSAGLVFRVSKPDLGVDAYCGYYVGISAEHSQLEFGYASNSWHSIATVPMKVAPNALNHLKVQTVGPHIGIFVSNMDEPVLDLNDHTFAAGMIGVRVNCTDDGAFPFAFSNLLVTESGTTTTMRRGSPTSNNIGRRADVREPYASKTESGIIRPMARQVSARFTRYAGGGGQIEYAFAAAGRDGVLADRSAAATRFFRGHSALDSQVKFGLAGREHNQD
jgi:hypothetical protein